MEKRHNLTLQDNTDVADNIVWEIKRTLPARNHSTVVAICGSASMGKTTFANLLEDRIKLKLENSISVSVLPTDSYMYSRSERITKNISGYSPSSHNLIQLENDITDLVNGKAIKITPYSHETGTHKPEIEVPSSDVIILEGLYSFYPSIAPVASPLRYFIYAEKKQVKEMRFIADCLERSYDVQTAFNHSEIEYDNYEEYILPFMRIADKVIIVDNYWKYNLKCINNT